MKNPWILRGLLAGVIIILLGVLTAFLGIRHIKNTLPDIARVEDYKPRLLTQIYDRNNKKIGEFVRENERRLLVPYDKIPKDVINAFLAAEDDQFFKHKGVNWVAIMRAAFANFRAGRNVQGGSTITQQVSKTFFLSSEKTYIRKIKELFLAHALEENLSKEDILYLYLNQIYFGATAHGIGMAAETYYRKPVDKLTLGEAAILAGLPKAPSDYSPIINPTRAKERQVYVLNRMAEVGYITREQAQAEAAQPITVYLREKFEELAPYYVETVRQLLIPRIGEEKLLDEGVSIYTSLDVDKQKAAQAAVETHLKALDKRQGYRGALNNVTEPKLVGEFLMKTRNKMIQEANPARVIQPDGKFADYGPLRFDYDPTAGLPFYLKPGKTYEAIVNKVDDDLGLVFIRIAEYEGAIDIETMKWARKPDAEKRWDLDTIKKPSAAVKQGDIVLVKVISNKFDMSHLQKRNPGKKEGKKIISVALPDMKKYIDLQLDQEPIVETGLLSIEQSTGDVLAMIGGYNFNREKHNKALQAARQTGSSFKSIVYAAAFDKGFTASTPILDAPLVYDEKVAPKEAEGEDDEDETKTWKPANHGRNYAGDIIFRNAIVRSLNIPTVKITEDIGVNWVVDYARRLGIFSNLNLDFTLGLGSSSVTLFEMTKVFAEFAKLGKRVKPMIVKKVLDREGKEIFGAVSLDERYEKQYAEIEKTMEERRIKFLEETKKGDKKIDPMKSADSHLFFEDPDQLISPQTAYLITSLLKAVVEDRDGTGGGAKALGREVAGKTGTTNGYFDAWFIGYTPHITTGVWVGFSKERSLGKGEVGGRAALPIWVDYMKAAHENLPSMTLPVPEGIVFANIDGETGGLASASSKSVIRQAYREGTEPSGSRAKKEEENDFYKQDKEM